MKLTLLVALLSVVFTAHAKTASEVYEQAAKSTVLVLNFDEKGSLQATGSGVVVFTKGNVVTNCHVVKSASGLKVASGDMEYPARLRYSDWNRDVCSLSITGLDAPAVAVGNTKTLKVGAKVYAIGAPKGLELTLSDGIVSSLREVEGGLYIQTTAAISPGSSGGGLFDENGALVGLTTFYFTEGQSLNFAVPVEWVNELAQRSTKASVAAQPVTQWLNKAIELESSKDWPALLEHDRRWTKAQPNSAIAWYVLGVAYGHVDQPIKAIESYQQALRIDPEDVDTLANLGVAYDETGQSVKAIKAYQNALRIDPEYAMAWYNLGNAYSHAGQYAKAIEHYQQTLRIDPEDVAAWHNLGAAYSRLGQRERVLEIYKRLKSLDPAMAERFFNKVVIP